MSAIHAALRDAKAAGREYLILATVRQREPGNRIRVAPGIYGTVVGTEHTESGSRVVFQMSVADAERMVERMTERDSA